MKATGAGVGKREGSSEGDVRMTFMFPAWMVGWWYLQFTWRVLKKDTDLGGKR